MAERVKWNNLTKHVHHDVRIVNLIRFEQEFAHCFVGVVTFGKPDSANGLCSAVSAALKFLSKRNHCVPEDLFLLVCLFIARLVRVEVVYNNQVV